MSSGSRAVLATLSEATMTRWALAISPREPLDMDLVLPALVDALEARDEPVVLVLDDLHQVVDVVREDIERLVRYPPAALRLVLVTRADPPIGLGRLRLEGWLTEIRARDLAFTPDEASALFEALDVPIAPAEIATLWRRTEGWSAGLCLAAMSVRAHPEPERFIEHFAGTDATVSDYLLSEVLARQPPDLRDFLLRTSIVDTVCGELADALTGGSDGQRMPPASSMAARCWRRSTTTGTGTATTRSSRSCCGHSCARNSALRSRSCTGVPRSGSLRMAIARRRCVTWPWERCGTWARSSSSTTGSTS